MSARLLAVVIAISVETGTPREGVAQTAESRPATEIRVVAPTSLLRFAPAAISIPRTMQLITTVAFSPDGKYLASGHGWFERDGSIQVWEVKTGKRLGLELLPNGVSSIAWTPDGKRFAASIWDSTVRVYDFPGLRGEVRIAIDRSASRLAFSPDGKQIVTAAEGYAPTDDSRGRVVQIWDTASGALVRKCDSEENLFRLSCVAWSPKGKYVAAAGGNYSRAPKGMGRLWLADTGEEAARLEDFPGYCLGIRFFPDDSRLATAGTDGTIRIWESATGKALLQMNAGALTEGLDIARDGKLIAGGTMSGAVTLWDPQTGRKVVDLVASGPQVATVAFSPDGALLATGGADAILRLWNIEQRKLERELPPVGSDDRPGRHVVLAPAADGAFVVTACDTGVLRAVDVGLEKQIWKRAAARGEFPTVIAVGSDKKRVLVGYEHGAIRLHSAANGEVLAELKAMPAKITAVAFAEAGGVFAAGDAEGRVRVWDREGKAPRADRQDHQGAVRAIGFAEKASLITTFGAEGTAICRAVAGGEKRAESRVGPTPVSSALISADGSTALVLGEQLTVWDAVKLTLRRSVNLMLNEPSALALSADGSNVVVSHAIGTFAEGPQGGIMAAARVTDSREAGVIALSADNRVLFQGTERGALLVWHALPPRHTPLARIRRTGNAVAVASSPDGKWLASGGDDSQITVWNLESGEQVESLPGGGGTLYALQFSSDSRMLASATLSGTTKVWGVKEWTLEGSLLNPNRHARCVAFSPDGRWLATGGSDRKLLLTDTQTWETAAEKPNQDRWVEGVAFSPDGRMLYSVTGSWDRADQPIPATLTAWKIERGKDDGALELQLVKTVTAHANTSDSVVVTPDSRFVVTGSGDGSIKVWNAATLAAVRTIRTRQPVHRLHLMRSDPVQLVVGDHFGGVSVWNIQTGACVANYGGHVGHVFDVTATVDGRLLISAGEDDQLLFWPGPTRSPDEKLLRFLQRAADD